MAFITFKRKARRIPSAGALCAGFLAFALATLAAAPARAAGEVALIRAVSTLMRDTVRVDSVGPADTNLTQATWFLIFIRNIAYEKRVSLWLKNDSAWDSLPCNWVRQADDENEYWELRNDFTPGYGLKPRDLEFKIMYVEGKHTYWDDNGGRNFHLARNGGTLLNKVNVLLKKAQWAMDTGASSDTTVFSGEAEVRGYKPASSLVLSFTTDNLKTQQMRLLGGPPTDSTWRGAAPADSDKVWTYRFSIPGVKLPFDKGPVLHFHLNWSDGVQTWQDDNLDHQYAIGLGTKLEALVYEELPLPVGLRYPGRFKAPARSTRALLRTGTTPMFDLGSRGRVDGIGRIR